eukprot:gene869-1693_t
MGDISKHYKKCLTTYPIYTKAITSSIVACIGELIGSYYRSRKTSINESMKIKRLVSFGLYGLLVSGPVFHYWYSTLDHITRHIPGNFRILYLQTLNCMETVKAVKLVYKSALITNWKVWTLAQAVNFSVIPLEYRVLYGNTIALWWNTYLSMNS